MDRPSDTADRQEISETAWPVRKWKIRPCIAPFLCGRALFQGAGFEDRAKATPPQVNSKHHGLCRCHRRGYPESNQGYLELAAVNIWIKKDR